MNKYLLLRDNKQTGPYTVDELATKGLKSYDLVWLDGKSAAWRYPSEIEELRSFAPNGEEQPYDRFYKKTSAAQVSSVTEDLSKYQPQASAVVAALPVQEEVQKPVVAKKIYVTMPANTKQGAGLAQQSAKTVSTTNTLKSAVASQDTAALDKKFEEIRAAKIRQAQEMAAQSSASKDKAIGAATLNDQYQKEQYKQPKEESIPDTAPVIYYPKGQGGPSKLLVRSLVAACILLVGVVIGLVINNSRQQQENAAIAKLMQQIQEKAHQQQLAQKLPASVPVSQEPVSEQEPGIADEQASTQPEGNEGSKNNIVSAVNNRKEQVAEKKTAVLPTTPEQTSAVKVIPAVVTNKPEAPAPNRSEMESARKNIHQLVGVEGNKYKTGPFGGISDLRLTISNNSLYPLDQVEVEVRYLGPEKRVIKTQTMLFNDVAAGEQKTLEAPRTNRGVTVDYSITRINSRVLGLAYAGY